MAVTVSDVLREKVHIAGAEKWLDDLPQLIARLERDWLISVGPPLPGGTEAYVAEATTGAGEPAVLKLVVPRDADAAAHEITALELADGDGCARLLQSDRGQGALLLERLGRPLYELDLPIRERHEILCDVASRIWRPAPGCGLPTGADKGRWLIDFIVSTWEALSRPCSERAVDQAVSYAARRIASHDDQRARLVHGDVHQWNALETTDGFALVDPDGLLTDPEYDLGVLMREDPVELLRGDPRDRAWWLADRTGCDASVIWEWGAVERVSTGLLATSIGLQPVGRDMLHAADIIAARYVEAP